jgi:hypothetical protein
MMIVGTKDALRQLGRQLLEAADSEDIGSEAWPREVAKPGVLGPYKDIPDFKLSFHLAPSNELAKTLPMKRHAPHVAVFLFIAAFTIIGLWSAFRSL